MREPRRWLLLTAALGLAFAGLAFLLTDVSAAPTATVSGVVVAQEGGTVAGAVVRMQTTATSTISGSDGSFVLSGVPGGITITVTAWHEGYFPGGTNVVAPQSDVTITIRLHPSVDNPNHEWYTSMPDPEAAIGCGHCMVAYPDWMDNAHAGSGTNPRFFSLYNGTDLTGTTPISPGYLLDFTGTAGNCATCHAPGAAANYPFTTNMNDLTGVETQGVFCDFCHKISGVYLNPATGLPYPNMPGVQSIQLNRPPSDTHMFYGPFDDVVRRVSYLELEKQSQFCAPCHQFSFWGTPIYESFREWLESPYPDQGIECQTCHMDPIGVNYFVYPANGGLIRDPNLIASHLQPGASDEELLQNTVTMTISAEQVIGQLQVRVTITNTDAGHHVPTDFPGRHMILTVTATTELAQDLPQLAGPTVPEWGGPQAGFPGTAFAKVLQDVVSGEYPVVSYWKQTLIVSDNRIPALEADTSTYTFTLPTAGGPITVTAGLLFRRAFQEEMADRGWDTPDIVMEQVQATLETLPWWRYCFPLVLRSSVVP